MYGDNEHHGATASRTRKVMQIATTDTVVDAKRLGLGYSGSNGRVRPVLYALCNDNTIWALLHDSNAHELKWQRVPAIPQDD
jgi:hypothetical protein